MSKKKHPEHVNHERWLVSYADFITLLFAFFVVLFASGQNDKRKTVQLAQAMQSAFQHNGIFDPHSKTPPISDLPASGAGKDPAPVALPIPTANLESAADLSGEFAAHTELVQREAQQRVQQQLQRAVTQQTPAHQLSAASVIIHPSHEGLTISLREAGFFASGSAELRPEAYSTLDALAAALAAQGPHQPMRVEGHTDDLPIHTAQFSTNWELSTARAASITRLLIARRAANPAEIAAAGYAEFRPTASNTTPAGRAENRRVDIVLLAPPPVR